MNENEFKKLFGQKIKQLRKNRNLTQEKLSELIWMDPQHFSKMESGKHFPSLKNLLNLARILNVEVKDLFPTTDSNVNNYQTLIDIELRKLNEKELKYVYKNIGLLLEMLE